MLIEDHYVINVARRIQATGGKAGCYHQHHMSIELQPSAVNNRREAIERLGEVCKNYPEPEYHCTLTKVVCRGIFVADSTLLAESTVS